MLHKKAVHTPAVSRGCTRKLYKEAVHERSCTRMINEAGGDFEKAFTLHLFDQSRQSDASERRSWLKHWRQPQEEHVSHVSKQQREEVTKWSEIQASALRNQNIFLTIPILTFISRTRWTVSEIGACVCNSTYNHQSEAARDRTFLRGASPVDTHNFRFSFDEMKYDLIEILHSNLICHTRWTSCRCFWFQAMFKTLLREWSKTLSKIAIARSTVSKESPAL